MIYTVFQWRYYYCATEKTSPN